jgi:hypothetical protein
MGLGQPRSDTRAETWVELEAGSIDAENLE